MYLQTTMSSSNSVMKVLATNRIEKKNVKTANMLKSISKSIKEYSNANVRLGPMTTEDIKFRMIIKKTLSNIKSPITNIRFALHSDLESTEFGVQGTLRPDGEIVTSYLNDKECILDDNTLDDLFAKLKNWIRVRIKQKFPETSSMSCMFSCKYGNVCTTTWTCELQLRHIKHNSVFRDYGRNSLQLVSIVDTDTSSKLLACEQYQYAWPIFSSWFASSVKEMILGEQRAGAKQHTKQKKRNKKAPVRFA
jgi:hypothetical protein